MVDHTPISNTLVSLHIKDVNLEEVKFTVEMAKSSGSSANKGPADEDGAEGKGSPGGNDGADGGNGKNKRKQNQCQCWPKGKAPKELRPELIFIARQNKFCL